MYNICIMFFLLLFQTKSVKFDRNFFNFEDVDVFAEATSDPLNFFKKTYGYDFAGHSSMQLLGDKDKVKTLRKEKIIYILDDT